VGIHNGCPFTDQIVPYVIGEMNSDDKCFFEQHLQTCRCCREEVELLKETWQMIPYHVQEVEPPADLKAEVMNSIFGPDTQAAHTPLSKTTTRRINWKRWFQPKLVSAVLLVALAASLWQNYLLREQLNDIRAQWAVPSTFLREYNLKSFDPTLANAKGSAWLFQQGEKKTLVFHVEGLPSTQGTQAYQVWLIRDGQRRSAGVFHVNATGNGVLACELSDQTDLFQAIGITLEPDANGLKPRGKKVLGT
jgi:anti-sigma-K factor RskA